MPSFAASRTDELPQKEAEQIQIIVKVLNSKSHYEVLGVEHDADEGSIKSSYKKMALKVHPDKIFLTAESDKRKAEQAFRAIQQAYETLSTAHARKAYDFQLKMQGTGKGFVPGEASAAGPSDDEAPSTGQFFSMIVQIIVASAFHIIATTFGDFRQIATREAVPLHVAILAFVALWFSGLCGFLSSFCLSTSGYAAFKSIPPHTRHEWFMKGYNLQKANWNKRGGQPFNLAMFVLLHLMIGYGYSLPGALLSAFMVFGTLMMAHALPQMSFGTQSIFIFGVLEYVLVYHAPVDVHFAIFLMITTWTFMQGMPGVFFIIAIVCALYLAWKLSTMLLLCILSLALIFAGGEHSEMLIVISFFGLGVSLHAYGFGSTLTSLCFVLGLRLAFLGVPCGKRLVMWIGLSWCLNVGFMWGTVLAIVVFVFGEFLSAAHRAGMEADAASEQQRAEPDSSHEGSHTHNAAGGKHTHSKSKWGGKHAHAKGK